MKRKILKTLITLALIILPLLISMTISQYSPYIEANSFQRYVIIWAAISIVIAFILILLMKNWEQSWHKILIGGGWLFLLVCPLFGIFGLASAPDLSLKMLDHPEREHLRYSFLFIALILFGVFIFFLYRSSLLKIKSTTGWIAAMIFVVVLAEFIWEFSHHYLYPEGLREWINQGKNAEDFGTNYDNSDILTIGVIGRYFQFLSVIGLSLYLYKLQHIKIWCPIINIIFSVLGIVSATLVYTTQFHFPQGLEFLMLFFIPGIPFFLLYWLGVALLTKSSNTFIELSKV